ncbi:MAG: c-type cytochrome [Balneolaceae bacterium]|nr:c-type cytochrome [Balneolaceae bacterium]
MLKKIVLWVFGIILVVLLGGLSYLYLGLPDVGAAPDITVEETPQQIERGRYLAEHVTVCVDCHSQRDWSKFSGPLVPGRRGQGGEVFDHGFGFPGIFTAKNITPHNLKSWSDGELYRLITTGVTKDGEPIFPVMPYTYYRRMDPEDTRAIIAYLRTLAPIEQSHPPSDPDFPMNLIMRTIPQQANPMERPSKSDTVAYGKYLTTIAGCVECHTPKVQGAPDMDRFLAGGFEFSLPGYGTVTSSNITPHDATGIGTWTEQRFVNRFKQYDTLSYEQVREVPKNEFNTVMPWTMYAGMTEEDLKAIYAYLKTVESVQQQITRFVPESATSSGE